MPGVVARLRAMDINRVVFAPCADETERRESQSRVAVRRAAGGALDIRPPLFLVHRRVP
jgi:hypothetical protein